jgi:hypothetical protein
MGLLVKLPKWFENTNFTVRKHETIKLVKWIKSQFFHEQPLWKYSGAQINFSLQVCIRHGFWILLLKFPDFGDLFGCSSSIHCQCQLPQLHGITVFRCSTKGERFFFHYCLKWRAYPLQVVWYLRVKRYKGLDCHIQRIWWSRATEVLKSWWSDSVI